MLNEENIADWISCVDFAVTVCDREGKILFLNTKAAEVFAKYGGKNLIGKNLSECHKAESFTKIKELIETEKSNTYTIEKNGVKKLIHQTPWYKNCHCQGMIEISIEQPAFMPHYVRY
jgi:PAS domain S-box-containing protein